MNHRENQGLGHEHFSGQVEAITHAITAPLNPPQRLAVETIDGPLLILAGAGSGKTRVLTHRIANIIATGSATPEQILAVTFTNKAAREMEARTDVLLRQLGIATQGRMWISTFHSIGARLLREHIELLDYKPFFGIYDTSDQLSMIKKVIAALGIDDKLYPAKVFASRINAVKTDGYTPNDVKNRSHLMDAQQLAVFSRYETEMKRANALDFSDLLIKTHELFRDYPDILDHYRSRFRYIMVDEYQDTNSVQYKIIRMLADGHQNLCVVGDEDQSIYSWRGADIQNILSFEKDFPNATVVKLEENYRSTKTIINAATNVIRNNTQRKDKTLFTNNDDGEPIIVREENNEYDEARYVVNEISRLLRESETSPEDIAVFYRTNAQSRVLEEQFRSRSIPYRIVGGMKFYDRMEVKDVLAYLKLILNPVDDVSFKRIINVPARGIGKTTVDRIEQLANDKQLSMIEAASLAVDGREFNAGTTSKLRGFLNLVEGLRTDAHSLSMPELSTAVVDRTEYAKRLKTEDTPEAEARLENLEELQNAIAKFTEERGEEGHLQAFLEEMALVSDLDETENAATKAVTMMTLHISKGLEYPVVFIVGCEEGLFPSGRATDSNDPTEIEEERRLCYVGMTRAEQKLVLTHCRMRKVWGQDQMNPPSRFLKELPKEGVVVSSSVSSRPRFLDRWGGGGGQTGSTAAHPLMKPESFMDQSFPDYDGDSSNNRSHADFRKGIRVRHPSYGVGQILQVEGSGEEQKVTVVFADNTVKKFVAKYARLEKT
ncbi:MAG: UvrD-helicase domain-containing protein [Bdellovibrionales bacterium]|nr:UvrD-helicase domain-containing protein [Bdellovibrionales bacterium]